MYFTVFVDGHQLTLVDCCLNCEIILEHSLMELEFNFCPRDDMDEPPSRGLSLNNPLTIRGQLGQSPDGQVFLKVSLMDNVPAKTQLHSYVWSSGLSWDCQGIVCGPFMDMGVY